MFSLMGPICPPCLAFLDESRDSRYIAIDIACLYFYHVKVKVYRINPHQFPLCNLSPVTQTFNFISSLSTHNYHECPIVSSKTRVWTLWLRTLLGLDLRLSMIVGKKMCNQLLVVKVKNLQAGYLWWSINICNLLSRAIWLLWQHANMLYINFRPQFSNECVWPYFSMRQQGEHINFVWGQDYLSSIYNCIECLSR